MIVESRDNTTFDVIIVGAGIAGLIAGAALAKEGQRVLLLEKADSVGGRMRLTPYRDYMIPVGCHGYPRDVLDTAKKLIL